MNGGSIMKKVIGFIIAGLVVVGVISGILFYRYYFRIIYNDSYVNGNTAGNLYNQGTFCESNGVIFFANPRDDNKLYKMDSDGSNVELLCDDTVSFINADEHYVYYTRSMSGANSKFSFLHINTNSLCRIRRDGKGDVEILDDDPCIYASLSGNYLYYLHYDTETATTLYKVKIDGSDKKQISPQSYFTCSTDGQYIYYNGLTSDHNIYRFDTTNDTQSVIYTDNCWMPTIIDDTAYFMDCNNDYELAKVNLSTGEKQILCSDRVDCYNVYGNYIYFQRSGDEPALCRIRTDGSDYQVIKEGVYHNINATSYYIYFADFFTDKVYKVSSMIGGPVEEFTPPVED